jgi:hypothetical protein
MVKLRAEGCDDLDDELMGGWPRRLYPAQRELDRDGLGNPDGQR